VHALLVEQGADLASDADETASLVTPFVLDRVDAVLQGDGVPVDVVRAARGAAPNDPLVHERRARALAAALDTEDFARAHTAFTRAHRLAERAGEAGAELDPSAFEDPSEAALADAIAAVREPLARAVAASDFAAALHEAARLGAPVDAFFDAVMVMADDPRVRANRLRLLVDATELLRSLGDLAHISR
jgi:glycyl-tRNA synthetase beta chain